MAGIHISTTTHKPEECHAEVRACPIGGQHFGKMSDAWAHLEKVNEEKYAENLKPISKAKVESPTKGQSYHERSALANRVEASRTATSATLINGETIELISYTTKAREEREAFAKNLKRFLHLPYNFTREQKADLKESVSKYFSYPFNERVLHIINKGDGFTYEDTRDMTQAAFVAQNLSADANTGYPLGTTSDLFKKFSPQKREDKKTLMQQLKNASENQIQKELQTKTPEEITAYAKETLKRHSSNRFSEYLDATTIAYDKLLVKSAKKAEKAARA